MRRLPILIFAFVIVALTFPAPSAHAQDNCATSCTSSTLCDTECWYCRPEQQDPDYCPENDTHYTTCGDYSGGNCATCTPNWVRTSRVKIGGWLTSTVCFIGCSCHIESYFNATYHDANNCGPADYTTCETDAVDFWAAHSSDCCYPSSDPSNLSRSDYCGGDSC
ncbi:MAG: hypothetical protein JO093_10750 [Acidobacteria bacterium]|nr:hypothetical protein [Acidobacteriota bacterium]MBV9070745.1 hypothetical protein [Acidobacteriota bacterium]MBV9186096.1 hypothetical protein [Acidobacteriota bacterium]